MTPEIILYEPITTKTDMWSLGVLVYVLLTGFLPFGGDTDQETFLEITLGELDFPEELFEDISAEAIDFIKKLLIRKPQSRMSARDCFEHPWMKADLSKAKIPPQPPLKPPTSLPLTNINTPMDFPSPSAPPLVRLGSSVPSPSLMSALSDMITSSGDRDPHARSCTSLSNTPVMLTPTTTTPAALTPSGTTPTILTPMSSSPRDIGLPPIHPLSGPKSSAVNSAYSSTNSLYRGGSRQSLDRARSLSKSREVLSERMQMSNQKKTLSKSRERLHEGRLGLSRSREDLWALRSFSHSDEALSVFNWLTEDDSIHRSCNNVFLPMLPMLDENRVSGRLYKSLASIDKIDEVGTEASEANERSSFFDSRFSINDEEYNHLITTYNTAVNSHRGAAAQGRTKHGRPKSPVPERGRLRNTEHKGGRGASPCQKSCPRHTRSEPQKSSKVNRPDRTKREVHKRRKGKKEKEKQRTESPCMKHQPTDADTNRNNDKPTDKAATGSRAPSPNKRRGSVSHIEQRIQERHERQQEKLERQEKLEKQERQEKQERRGSGKSGASTPKRRDSDDKNANREKQQNTGNRSSEASAGKVTSRSTSPPKRTKVTKTKSTSSEASPSSSLESVKESSEWKRRTSRPSEPRVEPRPRKGSSGASSQTAEKKPDMDEAYVSLEEPVDDGIFSRSESMDSSNTLESDHTVRATDTSSDTLDSIFNTSGILESLEMACKEVLEKPVQIQLSEKHELEISKDKQATAESVAAEVRPSGDCVTELSAINEEEDDKVAFARSVSTSSDIGSMLSENSEADKEEGTAAHPKPQEPEHHLPPSTWKKRGRSMSMQPTQPLPFSHLHLCRSNSFNLGMPIENLVAAPWGTVCSGAISRALEMFKLDPTDLTAFGKSVLERRTSLQTQ
ncbi:Death-associated protein kinase related [Chionoecetes opilio]|uniref:Death-associated protein kinase related n=1 Tax=Chionoecetes opilio TaxID=41210 RepID=A0A8J4XT86_CHIOP|nr:Death-associated protein kinase related [Chionoecetes opilio]